MCFILNRKHESSSEIESFLSPAPAKASQLNVGRMVRGPPAGGAYKQERDPVQRPQLHLLPSQAAPSHTH